MRLLIVGTGRMAGHHATAFAAMDGVEIVAGVDVREDGLAEFCDRFAVPNSFGDVADAIAWGGFDAACVVTPDNAHHGAAMPLLEAGKHVLCEKPLAPNHEDANEMAAAARDAGVINMVNLTYRKSAALAKAHEVVASGTLGNVRHIEASYLQSWLTQDSWGDWKTEPTWLWRLSTKHGSMGALGDVGVHLVDFACHASCSKVSELSCRLQTFHKAEGDQIGEYVLDANDCFAITAKLDNEAVAVMHATRFASGHINVIKARVYGDQGGLEVNFGEGSGAIDSLRLCAGEDIKTEKWSEVKTGPVPTVMESFASCVKEGKQGSPDFAHAASLQLVLDKALESDKTGKTIALSNG